MSTTGIQSAAKPDRSQLSSAPLMAPCTFIVTAIQLDAERSRSPGKGRLAAMSLRCLKAAPGNRANSRLDEKRGNGCVWRAIRAARALIRINLHRGGVGIQSLQSSSLTLLRQARQLSSPIRLSFESQ